LETLQLPFVHVPKPAEQGLLFAVHKPVSGSQQLPLLQTLPPQQYDPVASPPQEAQSPMTHTVLGDVHALFAQHGPPPLPQFPQDWLLLQAPASFGH
jgi:hypothetical protein